MKPATTIKDGSVSERGHHRALSDILGNSTKKLPKFEETKTVLKSFGKITAFGVNTHKGCVRNYNEDRVSILLNAQQRYDYDMILGSSRSWRPVTRTVVSLGSMTGMEAINAATTSKSISSPMC